MRKYFSSSASILAILAGCGGNAIDGGSGGSAGIGGSIGHGGTGDGGPVGVNTGASAGNNVSGAAGSSGGSAQSGCQALQVQAQQAADTSCQVDSDCVHPSHMTGDCTECGVVLNALSEESSLAAVRAVCQRFDQDGCKIALHSCPYQKPSCNAGACRLYGP